ncbi:hypothetical protein [Streptomyces sp. NPDC020983]|uniref:hypothetical protein n=1 Tax=Streptomyces sp. NPDC020983 TaxID=3365106 RepID=UPI0037A3DBCB
MIRRAAALLAGCALAAGPAGCGSPRPAGPPAVSAAMADLATGSGGWPSGSARLQAAFDRLDRACLGSAGFHPPPVPAAEPPSPDDESAVIDLAGRARGGYGIATAAGPAAAAPSPEAYAAALPRAERARFTDVQFGRGAPTTAVPLRGASSATVPAGGCVAAAREQLGGSLQAWARVDYVPQLLADATLHAATAGPRYAAVLAGWQTCMRRSGHIYRTPEDAAAALRREHADGASGPAFRRREIAVAVADGRCQARIHLPATLLGLRRQETARLPVPDLRLLRRVTAEWQSALGRAGRVLTASGS